MGIQGLIGLVENASTSVNISQLSGSVCVIDGYGWLHRACYGCGEQLYNGQQTDQYVWYCIKRAQMLTSAGIKPIFVFDGQKLPAKELTHNNRQSMRHNVRQKIELLLSDGNESKAKELMRTCIEVTQKMAKNLMNALRDKEIDFILAPFEADAQMAYLVNNGFADFVVTEDSDLLVYNCRLCLFKLDVNGNGRLVDISLIKTCLGNTFDANKFRHMSILSGCDYLPNLPGIGLQRAKKFFKLTSNTDLKKVLFKIPNYLKMSKTVKVTQQYVNDFIKADNTFRHQIVFCPKNRKLVPLTPYDKDIRFEELSYAGNYFDEGLGEDFAFQYAIGNVDTKTLKIVDSFSFEPKSDSIWSKDWFNYKKSFTKNRLILEKLGREESNKVLALNCNISVPKVDASHNSDDSRKRFKIDENRFIDSNHLLKEYSHINSVKDETTKSVENDSKKTTFTSIKKIYSRNIFKVSNEKSEESVVQSKYFSNISKQNILNDQSVYYRNSLNTKVQSQQTSSNISQYSLNSSGNTELDSSFDEITTLSDSEKSEISETSEEEITFNRFTKIKSKANLSNRTSRTMNSTFINSSKAYDIRNYLK